MNIMKTLLLASVLVLAGCNSMGQVRVTREEIPVIDPANPDPVEIKPVTFEVYNHETMTTALDKPENKDRVWYVIASDSLKNLNDNIVDMLRYITEQQNLTKFYKDTIHSYNDSVRAEAEKDKKHE